MGGQSLGIHDCDWYPVHVWYAHICIHIHYYTLHYTRILSVLTLLFWFIWHIHIRWHELNCLCLCTQIPTWPCRKRWYILYYNARIILPTTIRIYSIDLYKVIYMPLGILYIAQLPLHFFCNRHIPQMRHPPFSYQHWWILHNLQFMTSCINFIAAGSSIPVA